MAITVNQIAEQCGVSRTTVLRALNGGRIDDCISHRVMEQDVDALVEPFRHRNETWRWQSEFWGKWTLGAIETYRYTGNAALYEKIAASVGQIIGTQSPDGYIGNYAPEAQLKDWDRSICDPRS